MVGSSPQARGTQVIECICHIRLRFIPAGAGNTSMYHCSDSCAPVHPRRRGEHADNQPTMPSYPGSSPQARGTQRGPLLPVLSPRFIPAGAGNTARSDSEVPKEAVHPRRRGEHQDKMNKIAYKGGSSPQARGTPDKTRAETAEIRFIPAGAGNTHSYRPGCAGPAVHPRRRGEHPVRRHALLIAPGSSPQARGTR